MRGISPHWLWLLWFAGTMVLGGWLYMKLESDDRLVFVPGRTTAGHYQIELACDACHTSRFAGAEAMQSACNSCHAEELDEARDSHPQSKFTDPRNADRVAKLDARFCVTCHVEHKPERTLAMGLTMAVDYCELCHADVAAERPTHTGMGFETCASAGCHNFHDNRALYEDFLLRHAGEPDLLDHRRIEPRNFATIAAYLDGYPKDRYPVSPLPIEAADGPASLMGSIEAEHWSASAHAAGGVDCSACHVGPASAAWRDSPGYENCAVCHVNESSGFLQGRHGMRQDAARLGIDLAPMRVADARLPMRSDARGRMVDCASCHDPHTADTQAAVVEACLECHADEHSLAYLDSPHARLWADERSGAAPPGAAVTCATCHMPRVQESYEYGTYIHTLVLHNQSASLRPNEKMLRPVCLECHGYEFSVNALADVELIERNFAGPPGVVVESTELALQRRAAVEAERTAAQAPAISGQTGRNESAETGPGTVPHSGEKQ